MDRARVRELAEAGLPGFTVGFIAGTVAGFMAMVVGQPIGWAFVGVLTLGLPLGLLGAGYSVLLALGLVRIGGFAPAALFWLFGFPLARLLQEVLTRFVLTGTPGFPADLLGFVAYQGLISAGFAFGFLWLHERIAPQVWRKQAEHNVVSAGAYRRYSHYAKLMYDQRQARSRRREASKSR
ncbi:MAG: hypothetical protein ABW215_03900 [Kibdelosporangium sp.]